mgnify:CR=1 FL=1|jgi:pyridoxal phosphate enzyme (YggS family)
MSIAENLAHVRARIDKACDHSARDPAHVTLVAVSKTHPVEAVLEAAACGVRHFGENRVEEASVKIPQVQGRTLQPLTWHMIGHLQSRKAVDALLIFQIIHSVDTLKLAEKLSRLAADLGQSIDILLECNVSGEASKYGVTASGWERDTAIYTAVHTLVSQITSLPHVRLRGLMTMAPIVSDMEATRPVFASLARLRKTLEAELGIPLPDLSMGMTDDYPIAIEEGATIIRVGRAIFGERTVQQKD